MIHRKRRRFFAHFWPLLESNILLGYYIKLLHNIKMIYLEKRDTSTTLNSSLLYYVLVLAIKYGYRAFHFTWFNLVMMVWF